MYGKIDPPILFEWDKCAVCDAAILLVGSMPSDAIPAETILKSLAAGRWLEVGMAA